jgi:soluble lytic murein transglycosylase-like protein
MDPRTSLRTPLNRARGGLRRLTASVTTGGMMLVGMPLALDYIVRPGDTLSEIAAGHDTTVDRIVSRNDLHSSGDRITAGESLDIPAAHGRPSSSAGRASGEATADDGARRIVDYTVRSGDTPSGLAVRFQAWTAEVVEMNGPVLRVGERIKIPVVVAAERQDHQESSDAPSPSARSGATDSAGRSSSPSTQAGPSRAAVRRVIASTARRHGVAPDLALAVAWQESGWQMHPVSSAGAIGAMQVLPATGRWMSGVVGRPLNLRDVQDNATAGVVLLDLLLERARPRVAVAGYYQGLAGVRRHGMYRDTERYVANVLALQRQFERGDHPA